MGAGQRPASKNVTPARIASMALRGPCALVFRQRSPRRPRGVRQKRASGCIRPTSRMSRILCPCPCAYAGSPKAMEVDKGTTTAWHGWLGPRPQRPAESLTREPEGGKTRPGCTEKPLSGAGLDTSHTH